MNIMYYYLNFFDKLDLGGDQKSVALLNLSIYYTWRNIT